MRPEDILDIEKKYGLYDDTIDGVNYWVYARHLIFQSYFPKLQGVLHGDIHAQSSGIADVLKKIPSLVYHSFSRGSSKAGRADICIINHERRVWDDGRFVCKYTDSLYRNFEQNCICLERPYRYSHLKPISEKRVVYLDGIFLSCILHYWSVRLFHRKRYRSLCRQVKAHTAEALKEIAACYGVELPPDSLVNVISMLILKTEKRIGLTEDLLDRIQPRIIVELVGYEHMCMTVNEIAHDRGIPIVELQHGTINEWHWAYNYANTGSIRQFPDYVLLFGEFWRRAVRWPIEETRVISAGFPYLEEKRKLPGLKRKQGGETVVLFLSQGIIGERLSGLACRLRELVKAEKLPVRIIYKLHPGEYPIWKQRYPALYAADGEGGFTVIDTDKSDLYRLFGEADLQIGVFSTAILEGIMWDLKTLIYRIWEPSAEIQYLCDHGMAHYIDTAEDILDHLAGENTDNRIDADYVWKRDAARNLSRLVKDILGAAQQGI